MTYLAHCLTEILLYIHMIDGQVKAQAISTIEFLNFHSG